ncbi:MAG: PKD domain-containing protein [Candidatus Saccharimonas sp.]
MVLRRPFFWLFSRLPRTYARIVGLTVAMCAIILLTLAPLAHAWERPGPGAGSVGVTGVVPGKPPTKGATIKTPANGQRFAQTPVIISGDCPPDSLIEVYKNDIFAGSAICSATGTFSFEIDLMIGENKLVARVYDALSQQGPDSNIVTVFYDITGGNASPLVSLNFGGPQLLINTDSVFRGTFPGQEMLMPLDIIGGRAPFAVNIQWGDSTNKVVSRPDNTSFHVAHTYLKAGTYAVTIQATDADGRVAFLTVAAIVNGQPEAATATTTSTKTNSLWLWLLPIIAAIIAIVVGFWLGEWRQRRVLEKSGQLVR